MPTTTEAERQEVPLSHEQEQLWLSHQLLPDATLDHECVMVAFPAGGLDTESLRQSLDAFIQRHEIWRPPSQPHGAHGSGGPVQVVRPQGQSDWSVLDLSDRPGAEAGAEALRSAQAAAQQPFDLAHGPLVRALLVRLSAGQHRLFLTLPRIISDWVSLTEVFRPELQALYEATNHRRPAGLRALSEREQVPLTATLTAAFSTLMSRYTGQEDLLIGTVSERGPEPQDQPMVGCFLNTVVHRADLAGDPTVAELLRRTQTASQHMLPHARGPFDQVVKEM